MHLIVAIDRHGAIGRGGDQPFYIREDLRHFKELTTGHTVVMGRRTFEALPKGALPNRRNIVVTRQEGYNAPGAEVAPSLEAALAMASPHTFIIGGAEIYRQALPLADTLHITVVDAVADGADTYLPAIDLDAYRVTRLEIIPSTPPCRFVTLERKC